MGWFLKIHPSNLFALEMIVANIQIFRGFFPYVVNSGKGLIPSFFNLTVFAGLYSSSPLALSVIAFLSLSFSLINFLIRSITYGSGGLLGTQPNRSLALLHCILHYSSGTAPSCPARLHPSSACQP